MTIYWRYFLYVLEHKRNVFKACWKRKLYIHAFTHDLSKLLPWEFAPYAHYFFESKTEPGNKERFEEAWRHHYEGNPHHWNHWVDMVGVAEPMPERSIYHMVADWEAMSMKFGGTAQGYYLTNYEKINLHHESRLILEAVLGINDSIVHGCGKTLKDYALQCEERIYNARFRFIKDNYGIDTYTLLNNE